MFLWYWKTSLLHYTQNNAYRFFVFTGGWFSWFVGRGGYRCSCNPPQFVFLSGWGVASFDSLNIIRLRVQRSQANTNCFSMAASYAHVFVTVSNWTVCAVGLCLIFVKFHVRGDVRNLCFYDAENALTFYCKLHSTAFFLVFSSGLFSWFVGRSGYGRSCIPPRLVFLSGWALRRSTHWTCSCCQWRAAKLVRTFSAWRRRMRRFCDCSRLNDAYRCAWFHVFRVP